MDSEAGKKLAARARELLAHSRAWSDRLRERIWSGEVELTKPDPEREKMLRRHGYIK